MLYFRPKKTHVGTKFTLQFNVDCATISTTDQNGKALNYNGNPYCLYNYEMVNVGDLINTDPETQYNYEIARGVTFVLSASEAINNKIQDVAQKEATISLELVQDGDKNYWKVEPLKDKIDPIPQQAPVGPDWDKIAEGKVRHGFALEAFKLGLALTQDTKNTIHEWVQYVMVGDTVKEDDLPF